MYNKVTIVNTDIFALETCQKWIFNQPHTPTVIFKIIDL